VIVNDSATVERQAKYVNMLCGQPSRRSTTTGYACALLDARCSFSEAVRSLTKFRYCTALL